MALPGELPAGLGWTLLLRAGLSRCWTALWLPVLRPAGSECGAPRITSHLCVVSLNLLPSLKLCPYPPRQTPCPARNCRFGGSQIMPMWAFVTKSKVQLSNWHLRPSMVLSTVSISLAILAYLFFPTETEKHQKKKWKSSWILPSRISNLFKLFFKCFISYDCSSKYLVNTKSEKCKTLLF